MEDWRAGGFGLYIHWPFCVAKCPYCDFNSHVSAQIDETVWLNAYLGEIDRVAAETEGRVLQSVFFGGGTPSLMAPRTVGAILDRIAARWPLSNQIEITLEANPGTVEAARFDGFARAGVNRVSLGLQALDDASLKRLGRIHSAREGLAALEIAQTAFARVSVDLIYARQFQTLSEWERELAQALALGTGHLSLYQLTVEDGTQFGRLAARGKFKGLPPEDASADMFELTQEMCASLGLTAYEVSNHAKEGQESRHNLIYWRSGDWAAVGPGAHGRVTLSSGRLATEAHRAPKAWLAAVATEGNGDSARSVLAAAEHATEMLLMGLRLTEGLSLARVRALAPEIAPQAAVEELESLGLVREHEGRLATTDRGRPLLDAILRKLA